MPDDVRRIDPPRRVLVLHDGAWLPGWQDGWVRWPDGTWRASVTYSAGVGEKYVRLVAAGSVRPVE